VLRRSCRHPLILSSSALTYAPLAQIRVGSFVQTALQRTAPITKPIVIPAFMPIVVNAEH
jgi:hypothetical protein